MSRSGATTDVARPNGRVTEDELVSAMPARSAHREVKVGVFVILGLLAFFVALFTLTDVGTFRGRYNVMTVVEDAGGMRRGDPVQMRGVNIGRVSDFRMTPEGVAVQLELFNRYDVPADSRVLIRSSGLLGGMLVDVIPGDSPETVDEGDVLPGGVEAGLTESAAIVGAQADTVLQRMQTLLSQGTIGAVGESAIELRALLADLTLLAAQQRQELAELSASLRRASAGFEPTGPQIEQTAARFDSLALRLDETTATLGRASSSLESVLGRLERGEGTLGRLSTDEELYVNLNGAASDLRELLAEIRRDPRRYLNVSVF